MPWLTAQRAIHRVAVGVLLFGLVVASVLSFLVVYAIHQRDNDLRRISCDALRREVSSRESAVTSGLLFSEHLDSPVLRAYYKASLPTRRARRDEARAEFVRLGCPTKEAS